MEGNGDLEELFVTRESARVESQALRIEHHRILVIARLRDGARVVEELGRLVGLGDKRA